MATESAGAEGRWSRLADSRLEVLLVGPTVVWFAIFLLGPLAVILYYSFLTVENFHVVQQLTLQTWTTSVFTPTNVRIFAFTFLFGAIVTGLALLVGYPVAYYLRFYVDPNVAFFFVLVFIIPFWISGIIRALAWWPILGKTGLINQLLIMAGLIQQPVTQLLFSPYSMIVGFLENYVVFMFVPIYVSLLDIDEDLLDASETLRGDPIETFRHVTWPLSLPGVVIGAIFVFVLTIGDFIVPQFLSGGQTTVPGLIYLQVNQGLDYPTAGALSIVLLVIILAIVAALLRRVDVTETF